MSPEGPNIWILQFECTTYSNFQLLNHGNRKRDKVEVDQDQGTKQELEADDMAKFAEELICALINAGKFAFLENSGYSHKGADDEEGQMDYPKIWETQAIKETLRKTGMQTADINMCSFGAGPVEGGPLF